MVTTPMCLGRIDHSSNVVLGHLLGWKMITSPNSAMVRNIRVSHCLRTWRTPFRSLLTMHVTMVHASQCDMQVVVVARAAVRGVAKNKDKILSHPPWKYVSSRIVNNCPSTRAKWPLYGNMHRGGHSVKESWIWHVPWYHSSSCLMTQ